VSRVPEPATSWYGSQMVSVFTTSPPKAGSLFLVALATALYGCGSGSSAQPAADASTPDASAPETSAPDAETDAGTDAPVAFPAFTVDYPQIVKNQGTVLGKPVIVTVTWPGDSNVSTWEAFGDGLGASDYWSATTQQYGVGAATSGPSNHVHMTQALPTSLSYTDLQTFVAAAIQAAGSDAGAPEAGVADAGADASAPNPSWPVPVKDANGNAQTIYSLFIPPAISVTDPGSGMPFCMEGALGYHDDVVVNGIPVAYSVSLECPSMAPSGIEETAAHECVEASTNPYPESKTLGYVGFDPEHLAWDLYTGFNDELADACENWADAYYQDTGSFPFWVQRSWSNAAALTGHDPCVPAPAGAYHGMTLFPSQETTLKVDLSSIGGGTSSTHGFGVSIGKPLTFQVGFFSDATTAPWTIAYDFPAQTQLFTETGAFVGNGKGTVSIDKTTGQNGDKATVTVTVTAKGDAGFHVMAITWDPPSAQSGYLPHYLPLVLVDQ